jgi:hypothetical protein
MVANATFNSLTKRMFRQTRSEYFNLSSSAKHPLRRFYFIIAFAM